MKGEAKVGDIEISILKAELDKAKAEIEVKEVAIANLNSELKQVRGENKTLISDLLECRPNLRVREVEVEGLRVELDARDVAIAKLESQISGTITELRERDIVIANLNSEIKDLRGELEDRNMALESLKSESRGGGDKPLSLFPTESTPIPEIIPELIPIPSTGTIGRNDLFKYILEKLPDSEMNPQKITDAVRDRDKGNGFSRLSFYERDYGFKFVGKIKGENRFQIV